MKKLETKIAIVTGAGAGMGKAMALLFASEGSKVIATDIGQKRRNEPANEINGEPVIPSLINWRCLA